MSPPMPAIIESFVVSREKAFEQGRVELACKVTSAVTEEFSPLMAQDFGFVARRANEGIQVVFRVRPTSPRTRRTSQQRSKLFCHGTRTSISLKRLEFRSLEDG